MAKKRTKTKAKEPIKIWVKPLKNGNKAIYLRTYQAKEAVEAIPTSG